VEERKKEEGDETFEKLFFFLSVWPTEIKYLISVGQNMECRGLADLIENIFFS